MPTHQLFDLPVSNEGSVRSPSPFEDTPGGVKRQGGSRKPRERISTKDFIPPDVSGLSKREARLVKNRAAAFLSRQRKREEFETMEVRVAELEQENARLLAITRGEIDPISEVERLRAQLAAAEQRSNELSAQLALQDSAPSTPSGVKMESFEQTLPASYPPSSRASPVPQSGHKSGASLGLMVLLCALPSLLSLPTQSAVPTTFSLPLSQSSLSSWGSSAFDINSLISNEDRDWSSLDHGMDLDFDMNDSERMSPFLSSANGGKLELGNHGLDISFDAIPSEDGKIRVRIHPPSASASSSPSSSPLSSFTVPSGLMRSEQEDPFFGVGGVEFDLDSNPEHRMMQSVYELDQDLMGAARKRVKIALKNMPSEGNEGGEWEVEIC